MGLVSRSRNFESRLPNNAPARFVGSLYQLLVLVDPPRTRSREAPSTSIIAQAVSGSLIVPGMNKAVRFSSYSDAANFFISSQISGPKFWSDGSEFANSACTITGDPKSFQVL